VFSALIVCLGLLGIVIVPLGAFSALRNERVNQTLDLITQTSLSPRNIVVGKLMTQWVKLIILFAGLSPFITISFLLGGIDLMTILLSLAVLFMWSMWVCAACLFMSAASHSRAMSSVVFVGMAIGVIGMLMAASSSAMMIFGVGGIPRTSISEAGWVLAAMTALCFVSMTNLVLLAENRLSLPIEDRSTALRLGFFVQFLLIMTCVMGPLMAGATGFTSSDALAGLTVFGGLHIALTAIFAVTEDMVLSKRVFRRVRKSLGRPWLAIFRPGGGRGAAWILLQMVILVSLGWPIATGPDFRLLLATCSYILFFTGVPAAILRRMFGDNIRTAYVRASLLLFFPIVGVSADIFQYFLSPTRVFDGTFSAYHMLNPFRSLTNWNQVEALGWQSWPLVLGLAGLLSYLDLYRMGWLEDRNAAKSS
jgi:hypothetical protein